jgi:hypothetical protein
MRKIPLEFSLYESVYGSEFPIDQYYVILFDSIPSKTSAKNFYSNLVMDYFKRLGFIEEARTTLAKFRSMERSAESILVHQEKEMIIHAMTNVIRNPDLLSYEIFYNIKKGDLNTQIDLSGLKNFQKDLKKSSIQLVKSDMGHLDNEEYDLSIPELNLELNYGANFIKVHELIVKRLNINGDKGIILLHGDPGTGKTTYLKYLTKEIKEKNILFIPPSMAEILSEPSIIPFLMENRNSILLIEDAERVIADREGRGSTAGVSNLLNLTDGILGDCLNIQVIATFNMKRERIDPALLRKGRLICEHKFDKLNIKETNNLLTYLHKNIVSSEPLTLADIYNIDSDEIRITKDPKRASFVQ